MTTLDITEFYRSSDMALVAFLRVIGHTQQSLDWEGGTAFWVFRHSDSLMSDVDSFYADTALVNPREFNSKFAVVKREFYNRSKG